MQTSAARGEPFLKALDVSYNPIQRSLCTAHVFPQQVQIKLMVGVIFQSKVYGCLDPLANLTIYKMILDREEVFLSAAMHRQTNRVLLLMYFDSNTGNENMKRNYFMSNIIIVEILSRNAR